MNKYWFLSLLLALSFTFSGCDVHTIPRSNFTPIADAGVDQNVTEGDFVTLDGSESYDPYGSITTYEWKEGSNLLSTEVSFVKLDFSVGVHTITLTVTDNSNITATDSMIVTVNSATPPLDQDTLTPPLNQDTFTITVKTDNNTSTSSLATQFEIPTAGVDYNYSVDCDNDGTNETTEQTGNYTCDYDPPGTYTISIEGDFPRIYFNNVKDKEKILSVNQWGTVVWSSMERAFYGCSNLIINASDTPNLSNVRSMYLMFYGASSLNQNISSWDVSQVTTMKSMFNGASVFNQDIGLWDVSQATDMSYMFQNASAFDQNISAWDVSQVTTMKSMFNGASVFNQDIGLWDVSQATDMSYMFGSASLFNGDVENWGIKTAAVTNMDSMFRYTSSFTNHDLNSSWDVSSVTTHIDFLKDAGPGNIEPTWP